jgi:DNA repair protein RadC
MSASLNEKRLLEMPAARTRAKSFSWVTVRLVREGRAGYAVPVSDPDAAYRAARPLLEDRDREALLVLLLDNKNQVNAAHVVSVGSLNGCPVHPREVFKAAVLANAAGVVVAHNHPSGDPEPSPEDRNMALRLKQAGEILGIRVLDFLVVGDGRYTSLKSESLL